MGVLGHPLLAQVFVRLIAWRTVKPDEIVGDPTTLYRTLLDVTCAAGQVHGNARVCVGLEDVGSASRLGNRTHHPGAAGEPAPSFGNRSKTRCSGWPP